MKNLRREYVEQNQWLPIEDSKEGILVLCMDPEQVKSSRVVNNVFAKSKIVYRVTTIREFKQTVDQFFGGGAFSDNTDIGDMLSAMDEEKARAIPAVTMFPLQLITNWSSWSTKSLSMPSNKGCPIFISNRAWARTR